MSSRRTQEIKDKCRKFRILITGRANAGKTTILQRVCDTIEDPEIYNKHGKKVGCDSGRGRYTQTYTAISCQMDPSVLAASAEVLLLMPLRNISLDSTAWRTRY
jgi:GTPase SAR1 family protein